MNQERAVDPIQARKKQPGFPLEWVSRSRQGDNHAMELLYQHFKSPFYGLALRYTYNSTAAEDILQDIFIKIFTHIHELESDDAFMGWAYRIAVNTCLSYLRKHKTSVRGKVAFEVAESLTDIKQGRRHESMFDQAVDEALLGLSSKLKSVFILHDIQGFKHEEIAQILGCSVGTSKSQLFKARMKLRQKLRQQELL
jgi:RNA polymerase sigma-70 factor (ECF subfamily)